jgi:hypothetical protein
MIGEKDFLILSHLENENKAIAYAQQLGLLRTQNVCCNVLMM